MRDRMTVNAAKLLVGGRTIDIYGEPGSANRFIQPVDEHDASLLESEARELFALCGHEDLCIAALPVASWNDDLTPWEAAPVFGKAGFGGGAEGTLRFILDEVMPALDGLSPGATRRYMLCGYSLAGLFALWSAYRTDAFAGVGAASPSVWYPGWTDFAASHEPVCRRIYLSLGDREERTKNRVMAAVGGAIRLQHERLVSAGVECALQWNEGNHFVNSELRTAKAMAWLIKEENE